jgi:hypothetical protein
MTAGIKVGFGRTFAVPGRCWRAGVLPKPAVPPSQDFGRITPVTALNASDSVDYDKRTIGGSTSWVRLHEPPEVRTPTTVLN